MTNRYKLQDFITLTEGDVIELAKTTWCDSQAFQQKMLDKGSDLVLEGGRYPRKTMVVPFLIGDPGQRCLLIKVVDEKQRNCLRGSSRFEAIVHQRMEMFFGSEPFNLNDPQAYGTLLSYWKEDDKVTKLRLTYNFAEVCLGVVGKGFGSRPSVPSLGSNSYFKPHGKGTDATTSSPAQADSERKQQQYYRSSQHQNQLMHPLLRKFVNELSNNVLDSGRQANPFLMKMVGRICDRQILTLGFVPYPIGKAKMNNIIQAGCSHPTFGFVNSAHVDSCDRLNKEQVSEWKETAAKQRWKSCQKILEQKDFCLPTSCGYQFVFRDEKKKDAVRVNAFFAMEGLGLAMELTHGIFHHFMGSMFSHQTCLPVCKRLSDNNWTASNIDNVMQIVGWGSCGGSREVAEAKARARAKRVVAERRAATRA